MKNKRLLTACLLAGVAIGLNSCAEGDYNDLKCDSKYEAECLDSSHYMSCQNGSLIVTACGAGTYCKENKDAASGAVTVSCEAYESDKPAGQCDHESPICINDSILETCEDGKAKTSQCDYGCEAGACKEAPAEKKEAGESCTANDECKSNSCVPVAGGEAGEMECAPGESCADGATRCTEDGSAMETCQDNAWTSTSCNGLGCKNDKCLLADGEECENDDVCGSGFCAEEKAADGAEGGACRVIEDGADGLPCDAGLVCKDDVCTKLEEGMEGGACRDTSVENVVACDAGLVCTDNVCTKLVEGMEGAACRVIAEDAVGDACDAGLVCTDNVCTKLVDGTEGGACREIAEGADGLPCDEGLVCNDNKVCVIDDGPNEGEKGGACRDTSVENVIACDAGLVCLSDVCVDNGSKGTSCVVEGDVDPCLDGLECVGEDASKVCTPKAGYVDGVCRDNSVENITKCEDGLSCVSDVCVANGSKGAACRDNSVENVIACDAGLKCDDDNVCVEIVAGSEGGVCREIAEDADGLPCDAGLVCTEDVCVKIADGDEGGKCLADDKCNDDLVCNDGVCEAPAEAAASSAPEGRKHVCMAKLENGAACDNGSHCASGNCEEGVCLAKLAGEGESCENVDCKDGLACNESKVCEKASTPVDACSDDSTCGAGKKCVIADGATEGTCEDITAGEAGGACRDTSVENVIACDDGLSCVDNVCVVNGTENAPCRVIADGADGDACDAGLICDDTNNVCKKVPQAGEAGGACRDTSVENVIACDDGLSCVSDVCVVNGTEGAACRVIAEDADGDACDAGLVCDDDSKVCMTLIDGLVLEYCALFGDFMASVDAIEGDCVTEMKSHISTCDDGGIAALTCMNAAGKECESIDNKCMEAVNVACAAQVASCIAFAAEGESCEDVPCDGDLVCLNNVCTAACKVSHSCEKGDGCDTNEDCAGDLVCSNKVCSELA